MVPFRSTLRTAYLESKTLTPVAQPKDRARVRFKRLFLAPALRLNQQSWESVPRQRQLNAVAHSGKSESLKSSKLKYKERRFLSALKGWASALSIG